MKKQESKKVVKKIKVTTNSAIKKTEVLIKKAGEKIARETKVIVKGAGKIAKTVQKKWKDAEPGREKYKQEIKKDAKKIAKVIQKKWKDAEPGREKYKQEIKKATKDASAKSIKLIKSGIKNSIKIGGDIADVIRKDIEEIRDKNKDKK